jgi:hypothetical protein
MGQYECNFCEMGKYNRALAYRLVKNLSRSDMQYLLRWNILEEALSKKQKGGKQNGEKLSTGKNRSAQRRS